MGRAEAASAAPESVDSAKEPTSRGNFQAASGNPNRHAPRPHRDGDLPPGPVRVGRVTLCEANAGGTNSRCRMDRDAPPDTLG